MSSQGRTASHTNRKTKRLPCDTNLHLPATPETYYGTNLSRAFALHNTDKHRLTPSSQSQIDLKDGLTSLSQVDAMTPGCRVCESVENSKR